MKRFLDLGFSEALISYLGRKSVTELLILSSFLES